MGDVQNDVVGPRIDSRVESVMVFRRGARVTRAGVIARGDGDASFPSSVRIGGLPLEMNDGSLRVRVERADGDGSGALPTASDARVVLEVPEPDATLAPPEDEALRQARLEEDRIGARLAAVQKQIARIEGVGSALRPAGKEGEPPISTPYEARLAWIELRASEMERLQAEAKGLGREQRRARERRVDLEERWKRASTARQAKPDELRKAVVIRLEPAEGSAVAGRARIAIEYQIAGARWAPAYALRIAESGERATLALRAVVAQRTGEDWSAATLALSTADPLRWADLPELASRRIGRRQREQPRRGWRPAPVDTDALYADYDRAFGSPVAPPAQGRVAGLERDEDTDDHDLAVMALEEVPTAVTPMPEPQPMTRTGVIDMPSFLGPPMAAPASAAPRSKSLFSFGGGVPPSPAAASEGGAGPRPALAQQAMPGRPQRQVRHGYGPADEGAPVVADARLMRYSDLRLGGPERVGRGVLAPAPRAVTYLELMIAARVQVQIDVNAVIGAALSAADELSGRALPPRHSEPAPQDGFDFAYRADAPVDVPSDGAFHGIALSQHEGRPAMKYVTVPREAPEVFRLVTLASPIDAPLLDGPCDVYLGEEYLVTADLSAVGARGTIELGLGVEQAIKASRNTSFAEKTAGLMGGALVLEHEVRIELVSHLPRRVDVEVRERLPVVRENEDEIEVRIGSVEPAWSEWDQEEPILRGGYAWRIGLEPGEKKQLRAEYDVRIASKHELSGGNRREG